jgi:hypothetical protein
MCIYSLRIKDIYVFQQSSEKSSFAKGKIDWYKL